ncbi:hypothetical protein [Bacillus sp. FJAT-29937]|uniref:hypothetical protein n=1 Tax=Bacillus sp. FJAT-29937 TaxID=1720553 RepID=UPI000835FC22|nr:hypothetical protein [Bacillus sp. FJAT-29937]
MENTDESTVKSIIIATPNTVFATELKKQIETIDKSNRVEDVIVTDEDLIESLEKQNKRIAFKGLIITSDIAKKNNQIRLEYLSDLLVTIRERYPDLVICLLSKEKTGHPFLYEIVQMGIYNIFLQNEDLTINSILGVLDKPKSFSEISHLRNVDSLIPWRRLSYSPQSIEIKSNGEEENSKEAEESNDRKLKVPNIKLPKLQNKRVRQEKSQDHELLDVELLDIPIEREVIIQEKIVGTVVIAVAGVAAHIGATHTSITIATYLKEQGHSIALVEANYTEDFDRIHALYEGEKHHIWQKSTFDLHEIDHYKFRDSMTLGEIFTGYEFVILDIGDLDSTPFYEEFFRAHVKVVVCSALEWKHHWIESFLENLPYQDDLNFVVPFATDDVVSDIEKIVGNYKVVSMPANKVPYECSTEAKNTVRTIMDGFLKSSDKKVVTKSTVVFACLISVVLTAAIFGTLVIL